MHRREVLRTAAVVASGGTLGGCLGRGGDTGTLATSLRTAGGDVGDFSRCVLEIAELRVLAADEATDTEDHAGAELLYAVDGTRVDLLAATDAPVTAVEQSLQAGAYAYLKLVVAGVDAALADGTSATVRPPDGQALKFAEPFDIRAGTETGFLAGLRPVQQASPTAYLLLPVLAESQVTTA